MRRLRGDEGPLPKLTIELLDAGYRAIDPELKVRYIVTEAPADMPTTTGAQIRHSTQPPPDAGSSVRPPPVKASVPAASVPTAASAVVPKSKPASVAQSVPAPAPVASEAPSGLLPAQVIRQRDESPTAESPIHYRELALAVRPGVSRDAVDALMRARLDQAKSSLNAGDAQQYVQIAVFDHMFVKRPVRSPIATLAWKNWRGDPVLAFPGFVQKESIAPKAAPSTRAPSWTSGTESEIPKALGVVPEAPKVPSLAPVPVVAVGSASPVAAGTPEALHQAPVPRPSASAAAPQPEPTRPSVIPAPVVSVGVRSASPSHPPPEALAPPRPPVIEPEIPVPLVAKRPDPTPSEEVEISVEVGPSSSPISQPLLDIEVAPASGPFIDVSVESMPASELPVSAPPAAPAVPAAPVAAAAPVSDAPRPAAAPVAAPAPVVASVAPAERRSAPPPKPSSVPPPGAPRRRAPGEDLIGDLFERMHELAFMADTVSGAEFVLHVLRELIPCEGILVHVFDLGRREFVVVRAEGPNARDALLHRTPDDEPLVRGIMSRRSATILDGAPANVPAASSSLAKLGIKPRAVLCGAARLGGRYLGLIELANPQGGQPFHDGEANALDYVCEQFAEFVASRPIVLDADVVVGGH